MKRALVLGGAINVWQDAAAALRLFKPDAVIACKRIGEEWPGPLDAWVTLHPEKQYASEKRREEFGLPPAREVIAHAMRGECQEPGMNLPRIDRVVPYRWPKMTASGGSGLYAVKVALDDMPERYEKIVIAGIPMTRDGQHFDAERRGKPWSTYDSFTGAWLEQMPRLQGRVKSMSGWTLEKLGAPTPEWLAA